MKDMCNGTLFMAEKISPREGLELGTARSVGQPLTHICTSSHHTKKIYKILNQSDAR